MFTLRIKILSHFWKQLGLSKSNFPIILEISLSKHVSSDFAFDIIAYFCWMRIRKFRILISHPIVYSNESFFFKTQSFIVKSVEFYWKSIDIHSKSWIYYIPFLILNAPCGTLFSTALTKRITRVFARFGSGYHRNYVFLEKWTFIGDQYSVYFCWYWFDKPANLEAIPIVSMFLTSFRQLRLWCVFKSKFHDFQFIFWLFHQDFFRNTFENSIPYCNPYPK